MPIDGALLIDKPAGMTSAEVVRVLKRKLGVKKIGHAGTLDPMATGLLIVLCGKATKFQSMLLECSKRYTGAIRLGIATDTDDITGKVLVELKPEIPDDISPRNALIRSLEARFLGRIKQRPPAYSAIKVQGQRSYKLARKGEAVQLEEREVEIHSLSLSLTDKGSLAYDLICSSGTYVRSLARDIGEVLGCGACLESICRSEIGRFSVEQASAIDAPVLGNAVSEELISLGELVDSLPVITNWVLSAEECSMLSRGRQEPLAKIPPGLGCECVAVSGPSGQLSAVAEAYWTGDQGRAWRLKFAL